MQIPGTEEWRGYKSGDAEQRNAHKLLFGKSIDEVMDLFRGGQCIQRAQELRYMPRGVFRYYVHAFAKFVTSEEALDALDARVFLGLLQSRDELDPGSVTELTPNCPRASRSSRHTRSASTPGISTVPSAIS